MLILVLTGSIAWIPFGEDDREKGFLSELKKTQRLMSHSNWTAAKEKLDGLLEEHGDKPYVRAKRIEIEELFKTCAFWAQYSKPEPGDLISGRVLRYNPSKGDIKLRYGPESLADFEKKKEAIFSNTKATSYIHPDIFKGPYTIEIRGTEYPGLSYARAPRPMVHVCRWQPGIYQEECGFALVPGYKGVDTGAAIEEDGRDEYAHHELAWLLFYAGRPAETRSLIEEALRNGIPMGNLDPLNRILVRAEKGPVWETTYEFKSRHYHILSDMDVRTCMQAAEVLEKSYDAYTFKLQKVRDLKKRRFRVYLFSGEEGYRSYSMEVLGSGNRDSCGCYSGLLKCLLIRNLPKREDMMVTVRHEGFHQYLDRIMHDPPRWLNEGLAQYYEIARYERGGGCWDRFIPISGCRSGLPKTICCRSLSFCSRTTRVSCETRGGIFSRAGRSFTFCATATTRTAVSSRRSSRGCRRTGPRGIS